MRFTDWFRGKVTQPEVEPAPIIIPFQGPGNLDPGSQTWLYIRNWATEKLKEVREKNDSINRDTTQTAVLRGEIKILKELINLPVPKSVKGLLEEDY
jgi:hypothetical protein